MESLMPIPLSTIKTEDGDCNIVINLDCETIETSEEVVNRWNKEIRTKITKYAVSESDSVLVGLMSEYYKTLMEQTTQFKDKSLLEKGMSTHIKFFYLYYSEVRCNCIQDSKYLEVMEDILTFYCNLLLEDVRQLKNIAHNKRAYIKRIKVISSKLSSMLITNLLENQSNILHVLLKITSFNASPPWKDVMDCIYSHFLTNMPVKSYSDEAFCCNYLAFQKWKEIRKKEEHSAMDKTVYQRFKQSPESARNNELLKAILVPSRHELVCDSVTWLLKSKRIASKTYFDLIRKNAEEEPNLSNITIDLDSEEEEEDKRKKSVDDMDNDLSSRMSGINTNRLLSVDAVTVDGDIEVISNNDPGTQIIYILNNSDSDSDITEIVYKESRNKRPIRKRKVRAKTPPLPVTSFLNSIPDINPTSSAREVTKIGSTPPLHSLLSSISLSEEVVSTAALSSNAVDTTSTTTAPFSVGEPNGSEEVSHSSGPELMLTNSTTSTDLPLTAISSSSVPLSTVTASFHTSDVLTPQSLSLNYTLSAHSPVTSMISSSRAVSRCSFVPFPFTITSATTPMSDVLTVSSECGSIAQPVTTSTVLPSTLVSSSSIVPFTTAVTVSSPTNDVLTIQSHSSTVSAITSTVSTLTSLYSCSFAPTTLTTLSDINDALMTQPVSSEYTLQAPLTNSTSVPSTSTVITSVSDALTIQSTSSAQTEDTTCTKEILMDYVTPEIIPVENNILMHESLEPIEPMCPAECNNSIHECASKMANTERTFSKNELFNDESLKISTSHDNLCNVADCNNDGDVTKIVVEYVCKSCHCTQKIDDSVVCNKSATVNTEINAEPRCNYFCVLDTPPSDQINDSSSPTIERECVYSDLYNFTHISKPDLTNNEIIGPHNSDDPIDTGQNEMNDLSEEDGTSAGEQIISQKSLSIVQMDSKSTDNLMELSPIEDRENNLLIEETEELMQGRNEIEPIDSSTFATPEITTENDSINRKYQQLINETIVDENCGENSEISEELKKNETLKVTVEYIETPEIKHYFNQSESFREEIVESFQSEDISESINVIAVSPMINSTADINEQNPESPTVTMLWNDNDVQVAEVQEEIALNGNVKRIILEQPYGEKVEAVLVDEKLLGLCELDDVTKKSVSRSSQKNSNITLPERNYSGKSNSLISFRKEASLADFSKFEHHMNLLQENGVDVLAALSGPIISELSPSPPYEEIDVDDFKINFLNGKREGQKKVQKNLHKNPEKKEVQFDPIITRITYEPEIENGASELDTNSYLEDYHKNYDKRKVQFDRRIFYDSQTNDGTFSEIRNDTSEVNTKSFIQNHHKNRDKRKIQPTIFYNHSTNVDEYSDVENDTSELNSNSFVDDHHRTIRKYNSHTDDYVFSHSTPLKSALKRKNVELLNIVDVKRQRRSGGENRSNLVRLRLVRTVINSAKQSMRRYGIKLNDKKLISQVPQVKLTLYSKDELFSKYRAEMKRKQKIIRDCCGKQKEERSCIKIKVVYGKEPDDKDLVTTYPTYYDVSRLGSVKGYSASMYSPNLSESSTEISENSDTCSSYDLNDCPLSESNSIIDLNLSALKISSNSVCSEALNLSISSKRNDLLCTEPEFSNSPKFLQDSEQILKQVENTSEVNENAISKIDDATFLSNNSNFYKLDNTDTKLADHKLEDTKSFKTNQEIRLPLKKRRMALENVKEKVKPTVYIPEKEEISYPATPMISIAEVEALRQNYKNCQRAFKTPAERKEMPPLPVQYDVTAQPSPIITDHFNINNHTYNNPTINYHMNNIPFYTCAPYYSLPPILLPFNNLHTFNSNKHINAYCNNNPAHQASVKVKKEAERKPKKKYPENYYNPGKLNSKIA